MTLRKGNDIRLLGNMGHGWKRVLMGKADKVSIQFLRLLPVRLMRRLPRIKGAEINESPLMYDFRIEAFPTMVYAFITCYGCPNPIRLILRSCGPAQIADMVIRYVSVYMIHGESRIVRRQEGQGYQTMDVELVPLRFYRKYDRLPIHRACTKYKVLNLIETCRAD